MQIFGEELKKKLSSGGGFANAPRTPKGKRGISGVRGAVTDGIEVGVMLLRAKRGWRARLAGRGDLEKESEKIRKLVAAR